MHPEYLRTLIILLPTSRFQRANTKPPPHMIEMALASLRNYPLPRKPTGPAANEKAGGSTMMMNGSIRGMTTNGGMYGGSISNKRKAKRYAEANGDSSDEDGIVNASNTGVGYSNQFRSRQRARQHEQS